MTLSTANYSKKNFKAAAKYDITCHSLVLLLSSSAVAKMGEAQSGASWHGCLGLRYV